VNAGGGGSGGLERGVRGVRFRGDEAERLVVVLVKRSLVCIEPYRQMRPGSRGTILPC